MRVDEDVLFATGKVASMLLSLLRGRRPEDPFDVETALRRAFGVTGTDRPLALWKKGYRPVPVVLDRDGRESLGGILMLRSELAPADRPMEETTLAALRAIEEAARRGARPDEEILISCERAPELARLRFRPRKA